MSKLLQVDVEAAAVTEEEWRRRMEVFLRHRCLTWVAICLGAAAFGVGLFAFEASPEIGIALIVAVVMALAMAHADWVETKRYLEPIDPEETTQLSSLLGSTGSLAVLRYAAEVRAMGREFRRIEFAALKEYESKAHADWEVSRARAKLYGEVASPPPDGALMLRVVTINLETGAATEKQIDHNNPEHRQWLGKHCYWAFRNKHSIHTTPI